LLPEGLLVVTPDGDVLYRNRAMWEDYGVRTSDYGRPNIRYFFPREALDIFRVVAATGMRDICVVNDPGGLSAVVQFLPILRTGTVRQSSSTSAALRRRRQSDEDLFDVRSRPRNGVGQVAF